MAEDLSAPLGKKSTVKPAKGGKAKPGAARRRFALPFSPGKLPLARAGFGLVAFVLAGAALRVMLVNDPTGGRPVAEVDVNSTRNGNAIAQNVAVDGGDAGHASAADHGDAAPASTVGETTISGVDGHNEGASVQIVGADVPDGDPSAAPATDLVELANTQGLNPDLLEENEKGPLPRVGASGQTPFDAYKVAPAPDALDNGKPLIAIIVTGLGLNVSGTQNAMTTLPGAVTLAFAPYGKDLPNVVGTARAAGHEVLLEVPLEPFDFPDSDPGPDTLLTGQPPRENLAKLFTVMAKFGGYIGLINHMGARFTASASDFGPVMEELGTRGLGYIDDGSSNRSVSQQLAGANTVPFAKVDIPLDLKPTRAAIEAQLKALEEAATKQGSAIGVISALPISVQTLAEWSKSAADTYNIVPASTLMKKPA